MIAMVLTAIMATILLTPVVNMATAEDTMGLAMSYGPIGGNGTDAVLDFPEMNTTTFKQYWSRNAITIDNQGTETWNYWELHMNQMSGSNHSYKMRNNFTVRLYDNKGDHISTIKGDGESKAVMNHELKPGKRVYIQVKLHPKKAFEIDEYSLPFTVYAYTEDPNNVGTRAITSDTEAGATTLSVVDTVSITIEYSGTHPDEVYFTDLLGTSTLTSTNMLRVLNSGNVMIDWVAFDVSIYQWKDSLGQSTDYLLHSNTKVKDVGLEFFDMLAPNVGYTYIGWVPGLWKEYRFQMLNVPLELDEDTYTVFLRMDTTNTQLASTLTNYPDLMYAPYIGNLDAQLSYSEGTGIALPESLPGDTNILSDNYVIVENMAVSEYTVDVVEFLFQPLTSGANHITFANNADLILTDAGGSPFTIPLTAYTSSGITYGRALLDLDTTDNTKPDTLPPSSAMSFALKLYEIPSTTPQGSYSSSFTVTCSANPVAIIGGLVKWPPLPYVDPDPDPDPDYFTIAPHIMNSTEGQNLTTGDLTEFNLSIAYHGVLYNNFLWRIYDANGTMIKELLWNGVQMVTTYATYNNAFPTDPAPTYMFDRPGNYTVTCIPRDSSMNLLPDYKVYEYINVEGVDLTLTPAGSSLGTLLLIGAGATVGLLGIIYLATRKPT
jgi:hypothetical protein